MDKKEKKQEIFKPVMRLILEEKKAYHDEALKGSFEPFAKAQLEGVEELEDAFMQRMIRGASLLAEKFPKK